MPRGRPRGLLLGRELRRSSRRWRDHAVRVFFAVPPFIAIVVAMLILGDTSNVADLSEFGRLLFIVVAAIMMLVGSLAAPLVMARSILSERDEGTLDLLALTGLTPAQVLWGSMSARVLWFMLALFAAAPMILLVPTLGGVGLREVVALLVVVPTLSITFGVIAARIALISRSVAVAAVGTAGWAVLIGIALPLRLVIALHQHHRSQGPDVYFKMLSPLFAVGVDDWSALVSVVPWLVGALWIALTTTYAFRRGVATGWDPKVRTWPGRFGLFVHLGILAVSWGFVELLSWLDEGHGIGLHGSAPFWTWPTGVLLGAAAAQVALVSATVVYVRGLCAILPWLVRDRGNRSRRVLGRVWGANPVLWRELVTRAHGAMSRGVWLIVGSWLLLAVIVLVAGDADEVLAAFFVVLAAAGTLLVSVLLVASSVVDERRRGTLPLVAATGMRARTLVSGKVLAAMIRIAPLTILGTMLTALLFPETLWPDRAFWEYSFLNTHRLDEMPPEPASYEWWLIVSHVVRLVAVPVWVLAAWMTLLHLVAALSVRIRRTGAAFATSVAVGLGTPIVILVSAVLLEDSDWPVLEMVSLLLWPFQNAFFNRYIVLPFEVPASAAFWCLLTVGSWVLAARWMRVWGVRDRR